MFDYQKIRSSDNGYNASLDQSITVFKMIFDHQNLGIDRHLICASICNNDRDMIQNIIFGNGGTFVPVYPFRQFCQTYPPITDFIM